MLIPALYKTIWKCIASWYKDSKESTEHGAEMCVVCLCKLFQNIKFGRLMHTSDCQDYLKDSNQGSLSSDYWVVCCTEGFLFLKGRYPPVYFSPHLGEHRMHGFVIFLKQMTMTFFCWWKVYIYNLCKSKCSWKYVLRNAILETIISVISSIRMLEILTTMS